MTTDTPKTETLWLEHVYFSNGDEAIEALCDFRELCGKLERENADLRERLEAVTLANTHGANDAAKAYKGYERRIRDLEEALSNANYSMSNDKADS